MLSARPDLTVRLMRGNVDTRLKKLVAGEVDATLLAVAGLERLGEAHRIRVYLDPNTIVPAAGQGAIALEMRVDDDAAGQHIAAINHGESFATLAAERAVVHALEGSCTSPIAAWGRAQANEFVIDALAARLDDSAIHRVRLTGAVDDMVAVGHEAGRQLKGALPAGFFA